MATSVISAFIEFQRDSVNLRKNDTDDARKSRDWLIKVIDNIFNDDKLPITCDSYNLYYGSFERKTKKRPLDDIDIMIGFHGQQGKYYTYDDRIEIVMPDTAKGFTSQYYDNSRSLNSRKLINLFVSLLPKVGQYRNAPINRNGEAAILNLSSYPWSFDIVPCFHTTPETDGRSFYLIPDGNGYWKKTDPTIDKNRVHNINQKNNGRVLDIIRLVKYWNKRPTMPSIPSYLLECFILDYYNVNKTKDNVCFDFCYSLLHIGNLIDKDFFDPKNIDVNINNILLSERVKIMERINKDVDKATDAIDNDSKSNTQKALSLWKEIFGPEFPSYG
jgi:hypothetical protein